MSQNASSKDRQAFVEDKREVATTLNAESRRILLDLVPSSAGGQSKRAAAFLNRFRYYDNRSSLIVVRQTGAVPFLSNTDNTRVIDVVLPPGSFRALRRILWQNLLIPGLIRRYHVDTYISFSHYLPRSMPRGIETIIGVSNLAPFSREAIKAETSFSRRFRLWALKNMTLSSARRASKVVALSETCREILIAHRIAAGKIVVIPNGVDAPMGSAFPKTGLATKYGITGEYLLYVSNFHRYKNFERLVDGYVKLPATLRDRFTLVLVGHPDDPEYFTEVEGRINRAGIAQRVKVIPGLKEAELGALYANTTLFIFPSLIETCPNILLEAMSYGAPVLTGNNNPMPEFAGNAARYFDPLSAESIAQQIIETVSAPQQLEDMRQASLTRAQRYTWDDFTAKITSLYEKSTVGYRPNI